MSRRREPRPKPEVVFHESFVGGNSLMIALSNARVKLFGDCNSGMDEVGTQGTVSIIRRGDNYTLKIKAG